MADLERELSHEKEQLEKTKWELLFKKEQLQKFKSVSVSLRWVNEELETYNSSLHEEVLKAQKEATAAYEQANKAQSVGVQARFQILRQLLLQLEPSFNI